jgi:hypothetical protein
VVDLARGAQSSAGSRLMKLCSVAVIARSEATKQSSASRPETGLLRFARNDSLAASKLKLS